MNIRLENLYQQWLNFWVAKSSDSQKGNKLFFLRIIFLILLYMLLNYIFKTNGNIDYKEYAKPIIALEFIEKLFTSKKGLILLVLPALIFLFLFRGRLWQRWSAFQGYQSIRFIVALSAGLLAWTYSTYDFNFFYNQSHLIDRTLILLLIPLIWWRPIFLFLFVPYLMVVIHQFSILGGFTWTIPSFPIHIMILFCAFYF